MQRLSLRRLATLASQSRRAILLTVAVLASVATSAAVPKGAAAAEGVRYLDCRSLAGAGSYSSPKWVGAITQPTVVYGCPPLTSGAGFNVRYFAFSLPRNPSADSFVMTYYESGAAGSGVHPRLASGASTVKRSSSAQYYSDAKIKGFYHAMADLWAGGSWRLGAEKLSSPLGSTQTASYNIVFVP